MVYTLNMTSNTFDYPNVLLTGLRDIKTTPAWIPAKFPSEIVPAKSIKRLETLPRITIVRVQGLESILENEGFLAQIAARLRKTPGPAKIVFVLDARKSTTDPQSLLRVLTFFDRATDIEFVRGVKEAEFALTEALAKLWAEPRGGDQDSASLDPIGELKGVIAATKDLRSSSGRLSADKIAGVFGLSLSALASSIETTRQALFKTPDAEAIQTRLSPFERIARLKALLDPDDFGAWLNMSNELLDGLSPVTVIKRGEASVVANLVSDMLTGSPT